jgi:arylsulfatase A-like enzyme
MTTQTGPNLLPKNVLLIVLDDVGTDKIGIFDPDQSAPPYARTPRLDGLAAAGIRFTNVHANPLCSPTRASIQTGRYPFRTGMGANVDAYQLPDSEVFLAELLKNGFPPLRRYACGAFGKWHLAPASTQTLSHAVRNRYDRFYGTMLNAVNHFDWTKVEHDAGSNPLAIQVSNHWNADVVRADAAAWIRARSTDPFYAYVAFNPPHRKFLVPAFQTQDGRELLSPETRAELGSAQPGDDAVGTQQQELFYRAALEAVDSEIGYLLDDMGPARKNTMIFVVGDNGTPESVINAPHDPNHGKGSFYQHGIHVPMIVSGPLVRAPLPPGGHVCSGLVDTVDLWSTIAEMTGAKLDPRPAVDGMSFLPMIKNPSAASARQWSFSQLFMPAGPYSSVVDLTEHGRSLTDGDWKYIRTVANHSPGDPQIQYVHELYRVSDDPEETTDYFEVGMTPEATEAYEILSAQMDALSEFNP